MFAEFMLAVPTAARLILAILITVGFTLLFARLFYHRSLALAQNPKQDEDAPIRVPDVSNITGRIITITSTGFIFLLAFTLSQFWSNSKSAEDANNSMAVSFGKVVNLAEALPEGQGRAEMMDALQRFRQNVMEEQFAYLRVADVQAANAARAQATNIVESAAQKAGELGATKTPGWSSLTSALEDLTSDNFDLISAAPTHNAVSISLLVCLLGIVNLVVIAAYQPSRLGVYLTVMGGIAAITAVLLFVLIEVSNAFAGANAIQPILAVMEVSP